ncbi:hypothetical protein CWIS_04405 [Cellulomonas sp. A375-1]|nr:hypothetical protein CWIS_04405 [Cellulomonas sp. A375-1]
MLTPHTSAASRIVRKSSLLSAWAGIVVLLFRRALVAPADRTVLVSDALAGGASTVLTDAARQRARRCAAMQRVAQGERTT